MEQLVACDDEIVSSEHAGWRSRYCPNGNQYIGRRHGPGLTVSAHNYGMGIVETRFPHKNRHVVALQLISDDLGLSLFHFNHTAKRVDALGR